jgi:hypothetical protein
MALMGRASYSKRSADKRIFVLLHYYDFKCAIGLLLATGKMIKKGFLQKQVQGSRGDKHTTPFLRRFVLSIVEEALRGRYGGESPEKCLQASLAIQLVLDQLGISSKVCEGAVCFAQAYKNAPQEIRWVGFWGEDHHYWLMTEFRELVDLPISQIHLHPAFSRSDGETIPALWWNDLGSWPNTIRYIPAGLLSPDSKFENREDEDDQKAFEALVIETMNRYMARYDVDNISFGPILENEDSLNSLYQQGHPYLVKTYIAHQQAIPFPPWIQQRLAELTRK